jgi:hypothetical protein
MAGWHHASARTVAEAPDMVTDPPTVLTVTDPQTAVTVDPQAAAGPQLTVASADPASAVAPQLVMTQSVDPAALAVGAAQADTAAVQPGEDAAGNTVTAWRWKPPFTEPPGLGAGAGASVNCAAGGCVTTPKGTTLSCAVGAAMTIYTDLFPTNRFFKDDFRCVVVICRAF